MRSIKFAVIIVFSVAATTAFFFGTYKVDSQKLEVLAAPTRVTASDDLYSNKIGIYWDTMRGATAYRVFRNTTNDPIGAADLGTTQLNFFFDQSAPAGVSLFYWVRAESASETSALSLPDQGRRTGTPQQGNVPPLEPPPPGPLGNPTTAAKAALGRTLFWDEQLSSTRTVACGTCHTGGAGGGDPRSALSALGSTNPGPDGLMGTPDDIRGSGGVPGTNLDGTYFMNEVYGLDHQVTGRRSMSYINASYSQIQFWDGRATGTFRDPVTNAIVLNAGASLESQAVGPPVSSVEMAHNGRDWNDVAARVAASKPLAVAGSVPSSMSAWIDGRTYQELFSEAFGSSEITPARIAMAIAAFERTQFSDQTPLDLASQGITQLTQQEMRGRALFNSPSNNCAVCHGGNRLTDNAFHYIGVRPDTDDRGRELITGMPNDRGTFRTPGLRNVELRRSYFHNGRFTTLEEVVAFYNRGGDFEANNKPNLIAPLGLSPQQQADLVAFLKRPLTDPRVAAETGPFERPQLYMESSRVPVISGAGREGSGGIVPSIKAISPPLAGNPNFTVSLASALGNTNAVLVIGSTDPGVGSSIPSSGDFARLTATTQNTGAGNGWASVTMPVPSTPEVVGRTFFARWYISDPAAANGFSVSQVAQFTVFGEASAVTNVSISGQVVDPLGRGLRNATVIVSDASGLRRSATTSTFGFYLVENIPSGQTYTVSVASRRYRFTPQNLLLSSSLTDVNFVGQE